jgi:hypothetical protein
MHCTTYDSSYSEKTQAFTERKCDDPNCEFCASRPAKHPADCDCLENDLGEFLALLEAL